MEPDELQDRIDAFQRWHYLFEFDGGVVTPMPDRSLINRHEQRQRYFFDPLLRLCGGSLAGHRVLDLGCNAGFWSLLSIEAGADFVLGIDARETFIEQARLVFDGKRLDTSRYRFEVGNVFEHQIDERFDIVLCLGLLDHVSKPVELFELMTRAGAELIVIDSEISRARAPIFEVSRIPDAASIDHALVLVPSAQAVIDVAREFGFSTLALAHNMTDYKGMRDYRDQRRLAFMCSKTLSLRGAAAEHQRALAPWWLTSALASRRRR